MAQPVILKSNPHGINLILDKTLPFEELKQEILKKFKESDKFFRNARIGLSFEGRDLSEAEECELAPADAPGDVAGVVAVEEQVVQAGAQRIEAQHEQHLVLIHAAHAAKTPLIAR